MIITVFQYQNHYKWLLHNWLLIWHCIMHYWRWFKIILQCIGTWKKSSILINLLELSLYINLVVSGLGLNLDEYPQNVTDSNKLKQKFTKVFASKTQDEWTEIFKDTDACCTPVLEPGEAPLHPHNVTNKSFLQSTDGGFEPGPAPRLSRTPGVNRVLEAPKLGQHTVEILKELGFSGETIQKHIDSEVVLQRQNTAKL